MIVTTHAIDRARERFTGLDDLHRGEIVSLLRRVGEQGTDVVDAYILGQRYIGADVPGVGMMVVFVKPDRNDPRQLVIASTLTLADAHGAGATRPLELV